MNTGSQHNHHTQWTRLWVRMNDTCGPVQPNGHKCQSCLSTMRPLEQWFCHKVVLPSLGRQHGISMYRSFDVSFGACERHSGGSGEQNKEYFPGLCSQKQRTGKSILTGRQQAWKRGWVQQWLCMPGYWYACSQIGRDCVNVGDRMRQSIEMSTSATPMPLLPHLALLIVFASHIQGAGSRHHNKRFSSHSSGAALQQVDWCVESFPPSYAVSTGLKATFPVSNSATKSASMWFMGSFLVVVGVEGVVKIRQIITRQSSKFRIFEIILKLKSTLEFVVVMVCRKFIFVRGFVWTVALS